MDLEKQILGDLIEKHYSTLDKIIQEAFREHFGFELLEVQDKEELEHIIVQGEPIESFRYRGETFLYWKRDMDIQFGSNKNGAEVTCTQQFKKV